MQLQSAIAMTSQAVCHCILPFVLETASCRIVADHCLSFVPVILSHYFSFVETKLKKMFVSAGITRVVFVRYNNIHLWMTDESSNTGNNSSTIDTIVMSASINSRTQKHNLTEPIEFTLEHATVSNMLQSDWNILKWLTLHQQFYLFSDLLFWAFKAILQIPDIGLRYVLHVHCKVACHI